MSSQKIQKTHMPDLHFGQSFVISLLAIVMLTLVLPMLTPTGKSSSPSTSSVNPPRAIIR
jgi:hypothetical protein